MKTLIAAAVVALIGVGTASAGNLNSSTAPAQHDSTLEWVNG